MFKTPTSYKMILARSTNNVIGCFNPNSSTFGLPWRIKEDIEFFRKKTDGKAVVMGLRTFNTLSTNVLKRFGRIYVLTTQDPNAVETKVLIKHQGIGQVIAVNSIEQLKIKVSDHQEKEVWVCGGGEIYKQMIYYCNEVFETVVRRNVDKKVVTTCDLDFVDYYNRMVVIQEPVMTADFNQPESFYILNWYRE